MKYTAIGDGPVSQPSGPDNQVIQGRPSPDSHDATSSFPLLPLPLFNGVWGITPGKFWNKMLVG